MTGSVSTAPIEQALTGQAGWIHGIEHAASRYRMLSTLPFGKVDFWNRVVTTESPRKNRLSALSSRVGIPDLFLIGRLLAKARNYDVVLLAGGERADLVYAALAGLCPWIQTPHVILDAHWQKSAGAAGMLQRLLLRLAARLVREVQPHSHEEVDIYAKVFGIDRSVLREIPWSTSMLGHEHWGQAARVGPDRFVLTGGHSFRDYAPLMQACEELGLTLKVGIGERTQTAEFKTLAQRFTHVQVHGQWSNAEYLQQMAQCAVFALPIVQGLTRSTADQTVLNAMYLGKTVVATSSIGPRAYIRDGVNGFLVHKPEAAAWKQALQAALALDTLAQARLAEEAQFDARVHFNEHIRLARTLDNVLALLDPTHQRSWVHPHAVQAQVS